MRNSNDTVHVPPSLPIGYGIEHAQCVPPSEYSEPGFITETYQTLHPISSEDLMTLKYESEYPGVILRDATLNALQSEYLCSTVKQEVVSPDNMCVGRISRGEGGALSLSLSLSLSSGTHTADTFAVGQCARSGAVDAACNL